VVNRFPTLKLWCVRLIKKVGLYDFLYQLRLRFQDHSKPLVLSNHEQKIFAKISNTIANHDSTFSLQYHTRKRLAFVSPLPPLRSGISDYSADLLPLLTEHYDIDVIVDQDHVSDSWINENCPIRSPSYFIKHASDYDRVIYHFGNSPFHEYMFDLINHIPGVIVLHDFYLSHVGHDSYDYDFVRYLYECHGYSATEEFLKSADRDEATWEYPLNFTLLQQALNVIVHSPFSIRLAKQFYGQYTTDHWSVIPLLRKPPRSLDKAQSRADLQLSANDFVVCSFGLTGPIKLNHLLIDAWLASDLAQNKHCVLIFVGENDAGDYGKALLNKIKNSSSKSRIIITGWVDDSDYHAYLSAADVGVQLRTRSRGETSAAALDCMNYGLATIVNANGAMVELPSDAVYKLADDFEDDDLSLALESLWKNPQQRQTLATQSQQLLSTIHSPQHCAHHYMTTIESAYHNMSVQLEPLLETVMNSKDINHSDPELRKMAQRFAKLLPPHTTQRQLLIDVSAIAVDDLRTGIQRVVRSQFEVLLRHAPEGYRVEPVYLSNDGGQWHYCYARLWTSTYLAIEEEMPVTDEAVDFHRDDILFCADLCPGHTIHAARANLFQNLMSSGIAVYFQVFDLLPISQPKWFPPQAESAHTDWATVVAHSSGALCISNAVATELKAWCASQNHPLSAEQIHHFHLGADIDSSSPSTGIPDNSQTLLAQLTASASFLMVGTVEPRKGHEQTLNAFEQCWQQGLEINLVIVGKAGWMINSFIERIASHPELNHRLFWLANISDEFLAKVYSASSCLIAASEGEGFGLPLIEAAQHHLPIIARDIAVFREVAAEFAYYFDGLDADSLANAIQSWLELNADDKAPSSDNMPWLTWHQSTANMVQLMGLELTD